MYHKSPLGEGAFLFAKSALFVKGKQLLVKTGKIKQSLWRFFGLYFVLEGIAKFGKIW